MSPDSWADEYAPKAFKNPANVCFKCAACLWAVLVNFTLVHNNSQALRVTGRATVSCYQDVVMLVVSVWGSSIRMVLDIFSGNQVFKTSWVQHFWFCANLTKYEFCLGPGNLSSRSVTTSDKSPGLIWLVTHLPPASWLAAEWRGEEERWC